MMREPLVVLILERRPARFGEPKIGGHERRRERLPLVSASK
jgi:hypothetical protein